MKINSEKVKITLIIILIISSCVMTYYFEVILHTSIIYAHFFYLPIILSCIWWQRRGIIVAIALASLHIVFPFLLKNDLFISLDNGIRAFSLISISIIVAILSEHISKSNELRKAQERIDFYRSLFMHDVNNLFQTILSSLDLYLIYQQDSLKEKDKEELLDIIRMQAIRGGLLVSNTLKLCDIDDSSNTLQKVEVMEILRQAITIIYKSCLRKKIDIKVESSYEKIFVLANSSLSDIFDNILFNAVKYNNNPSVEIRIRFSKLLENKHDFLKMEFIDNGIGISDDLKELIFAQGFQKEKHSTGMGLGLSLVKKIIESYNGKIWVEDKESGTYKEGTNFILLIPEIH